MKKFNRLFLLCITALVLFSNVLPASAVVLSSKEYDLYFYGRGKLRLQKYIGKLSEVDVPTNYKGLEIIRIDDKAFYKNTRITSVNIPDTVSYIGKSVFEDCTNLKSVYLSDSVVHIGERLFCNCKNLEEVVIGEGITSFPYRTFFGCENLKSVVIPPSVELMESSIFKDCNNLTIYGMENSYAQIYANNQDIPFVALDEKNATDSEIQNEEVVPNENEVITETEEIEEITQQIDEPTVSTDNRKQKNVQDNTDVKKSKPQEKNNVEEDKNSSANKDKNNGNTSKEKNVKSFKKAIRVGTSIFVVLAIAVVAMTIVLKKKKII